MNKIIILASLLIVLNACSGEKKPSVDNGIPDSAAIEAKKLPELKAEDLRVVVKEGGPVVDFHCEAGEESGSIVAVEVDTEPPRLLFRTDAEFNRIAEKPCDLIVQDDINGDGFMDVMTPVSLGLQNGYYDAWIWSEEAQTYVILLGFEKLSNPSIDKENKQIRSFSHTSALEYEASVWEMRGKGLIPIRRVEIRPCEGEEPCVLKKSTVYVNENPRDTVTKIPRSEFKEQELDI